MPGGRPPKDPSETYAGKRKAKALQKQAERERKEREAQERKELSNQGLCKYKGEIMTYAEAGRRGGHIGGPSGVVEWEKQSVSEQERRKQCGRTGGVLGKELGWELQTEEGRSNIAQEGRVGGTEAWRIATDEEKERRKEEGRRYFERTDEEERERIVMEGVEAWNRASEYEQIERREIGRTAHENLSTDAQEAVILAGQTAHQNLNDEQFENLQVGQRKGREVHTNKANLDMVLLEGLLLFLIIVCGTVLGEQ